jgi:hypothetical protein
MRKYVFKPRLKVILIASFFAIVYLYILVFGPLSYVQYYFEERGYQTLFEIIFVGIAALPIFVVLEERIRRGSIEILEDGRISLKSYYHYGNIEKSEVYSLKSLEVSLSKSFGYYIFSEKNKKTIKTKINCFFKGDEVIQPDVFFKSILKKKVIRG